MYVRQFTAHACACVRMRGIIAWQPVEFTTDRESAELPPCATLDPWTW